MATRRELARITRQVIPLMGLAEWRIDVRFVPEMPNAADCTADPEYRHAIIRYNPKKIPTHDVVRTVVHECGHCVTWTLASLAGLWAGNDPKRQEVVRCAEELATTHWETVVSPLVHQRVTGRRCPPTVLIEPPTT